GAALFRARLRGPRPRRAPPRRARRPSRRRRRRPRQRDRRQGLNGTARAEQKKSAGPSEDPRSLELLEPAWPQLRATARWRIEAVVSRRLLINAWMLPLLASSWARK